ncbi:hypothetical protein CR513_50994, partial [Mucuna pruriens]
MRTKEYVLTYQNFEGLEIIEYSDSDFVGCQDSKRSMFGYLVKHTLIAYSTMVMEFVACFEVSNHVIWLPTLSLFERPLKFCCDNTSAIIYSNNNRSSTKSKFINIKAILTTSKSVTKDPNGEKGNSRLYYISLRT